MKDRPPGFRRRFYVHKIQKTYAIKLGVFLLVYSLLVFGLAFLVPHLIPAVKLGLPIPLEEQALPAAQLLILGETIWPGIIALIVASSIFSIYLTHRLAGPLYRFEESVKELIQGNLSLRIRLRKRDELYELAGMINQALTNLEQALVEITQQEARRREAGRQILDEMRSQPSVNREILQRLELILKEGERIDEVLNRFRLSIPGKTE